MNRVHDEQAIGFRALQSIRQIIRQVSAHSRRVARETGLNLPQILCLRAIEELGPEEVILGAVAREVQLSSSTVSGIVERLVKAGLVNRERSQRDRRRVHLTLTEPGRARLEDMPPPLQDKFLERLAGLPRGDQERLLSALEQVVALMDATELGAAPMLVDGEDVSPG